MFNRWTIAGNIIILQTINVSGITFAIATDRTIASAMGRKVWTAQSNSPVNSRAVIGGNIKCG